MNNQTKRDSLKNDVEKELIDFLHKQCEYDGDGILYLCFAKTASAFMSDYPISDANINVMTDQGLLVRADELAESYREKQRFPRIRIVYAALFNGSSLNQTLIQLEKRLIKLLFGDTAPDDKTRRAVQNALAQAIEIRVFAKKTGADLLYSRYAPRLRTEYEYEAPEMFQLIYRLGELICLKETLNATRTIYGVASSSPSTISRFRTALRRLGYHAISIPVNVQKKGFTFREFCVFQDYFPSDGKPVIISTVCLVQKERLYIAPYIFLADADRDGVSEIERVLKDICPALLESDSLYYQIPDSMRYDLITVVLNQLLLESVVETAGLSEEIQFQVEPAIRHFGGGAVSRRFFDTLIHAPKPTEKTFMQRLCRVAKNCSEELGPFEGRNVDWENISEIVDEIIYNRSIAVETATHCQLYGGLTLTVQRRGRKAATLDLFLQQIMRRNTPPAIEIVVAYVLYLMDIGYISAITPVIPDAENPLCVHGIRVEPLSLTLGVERFGSYLDLLTEMERHCLWGWSGMKEQLQEYVGAKYRRPELATRLWDFADHLHNAGQKFADWRAFYQSVDFPAKSSVIGDAQAYRKWYFTF